jgi:hypothetical protein
MIIPFTASADLTGRGKRVSKVFGSSGATANIVRLRKTNVSGAIQVEIQVPINTSKEVDLGPGIYQNEGWYVEVAPGTTFQGAVDLI